MSKKKGLLGLLVVLIIVLIGGASFILGRKATNQKVATKSQTGMVSRRSTSASSVSRTKQLHHYTAADLKQHPKLSAVSILLCGTKRVNDSHWTEQAGLFDQQQTLTIRSKGQQADYVLAGTSKTAVGYTFAGTTNRHVQYFIQTDTEQPRILTTVNIQKVLTFVNEQVSSNQIKQGIANLNLTVEQHQQAAGSDKLTADDLQNEDLGMKAIIFYGMHNCDGVWKTYGEAFDQGDHGTFHVLTGTGGSGRVTDITFGQSGGKAIYSLPDLGDRERKSHFGSQSGVEVPNEKNTLKGAAATNDEILDYVNQHGGRQALKDIHMEIKVDN